MLFGSNAMCNSQLAGFKGITIFAISKIRSMSTVILRAFVLVFVLSSAFSVAQTAKIKNLQKALPKTKDSAVYVDKLNDIAVLMHMKDTDSSFLYAIKAKGIASRIGYEKGMADATSTLGIVLSIKGLNHDALKMQTKALAAYKKLNDIGSVARVYTNLSSTHRYLSDSINSVRTLRKGLAEARKKPNDSVMALVYSSYTNLAPGISQDSSRYYIEKALTIARHYKDERILIYNNILEASILIGTPDQPKALPMLEKALVDAQAAELEYMEISTYDLLAKYYAENPKKALDYYDKVMKIVNDKGYITLKSVVLQRMMPYAERLGDKDREVKLARELATTVSEKQARLSIFFSDYIRYTELEDSNKFLELKAKEEEKRILILSLFSLGSMVLLGIIFFLYRKTRRESSQKTVLNGLLEQKNKELEVSDAFKNKLVSILAHDFRSPLISTLSALEVIKMGAALGKEEMDELYGQVQDDINQMLGLFDNTLQWIRQQLDGYHLDIGEHHLFPLVDEATQAFAYELAQKNITIQNTIATNLKIKTDKEMLQFINRNLISNAIKFSPENGTITISAVATGGKIAVSVFDEGRGLDQKTIAGLFSISSTGSTKEGAGIALAMCKDFIEKLGGSIQAVNGLKGAVFTYHIPSGS